MALNRRKFLKIAGATIAATGVATTGKAIAHEKNSPGDEHVGCLVDTTLCIGCRKCEEACNRANKLPLQEKPFNDLSVLRKRRRPDATRYTVINNYPGSPSAVQDNRKETNVKVQCMHCLDPACVSACIVGALTKTKEGAVIYDAGKCIGCRYCMVACPFEIPAYEYSDPITPRVMKCTYCVDQQANTGASPSCAAACPMEAIIFGERSSLLKLGHQRIKNQPDRYIDHIYGEKEVGGTSWLYLTGRPHEEIDLIKLPETAPPRLSEAIQHGIFNYGALPIIFYGSLAGVMWISNRKNRQQDAANEED